MGWQQLGWSSDCLVSWSHFIGWSSSCCQQLFRVPLFFLQPRPLLPSSSDLLPDWWLLACQPYASVLNRIGHPVVVYVWTFLGEMVARFVRWWEHHVVIVVDWLLFLSWCQLTLGWKIFLDWCEFEVTYEKTLYYLLFLCVHGQPPVVEHVLFVYMFLHQECYYCVYHPVSCVWSLCFFALGGVGYWW